VKKLSATLPGKGSTRIRPAFATYVGLPPARRRTKRDAANLAGSDNHAEPMRLNAMLSHSGKDCNEFSEPLGKEKFHAEALRRKEGMEKRVIKILCAFAALHEAFQFEITSGRN